ncbi:Rad5-like protein [Pandoravirus inopinatum]|uniref:Rad5-like protein n=1 Tax=Pandoravirus inopinatum TaxID=1605721 RepID=A0A0B5JBD2_9VIRU|nr:Rad5-like protein [Pandoravirus inopinatum]AJF98316.1 Rad5-like protein [Pandoravirus inopinatum]
MEASDGDDRRQQQERDARLDAALRASGVTLTPHPHQRTAVRWWLGREGTKPEDRATTSGGILADEMGLGKSMSAVMSVLLCRSILAGRAAPRMRVAPPPRPGAWAVTSAPVAAPGRASAGGPVVLAPTLIVCPKSLLLQWQREIFRHTTLAPDDLHLFYGRSGRRATRRQVADKVFVLTTYETVLGSFESLGAPRPTRHRVVPLVGHSASGAPFALPVPKPADDGIDMLVPSSCQKGEQGSDADKGNHSDDDNNTVNNVANNNHHHHKDDDKDRRRASSLLHDIVWDRIVLDEAHVIRNWQTSKTHRAVCALRADRRWCLTGTAFNNSASDVVALCRFVGVAPYADPRWWTAPDDDQVDAWRRTFLLRRTKAALLMPDSAPPSTRPSPTRDNDGDDVDTNQGADCAPVTVHAAQTSSTTMSTTSTTIMTMSSAVAAALGPASLPPKVEKVRRVP